MKDFEGVVALQVDSIIAGLRHMQEERSQRLLREAKNQARELKRSARRKLHAQVRDAVRDERRRREKALQMAEHRIRAEAGQRMQVLYAGLLEDGWPALVDELEQRWSDARTRASWCDMVAIQALDAFGRSVWTIEHPADWTNADRERMEHTLASHGVPPATFAPDPSASAGLRVRHGSACLDGTIEGLLADRARVEGRLLAAWEQTAPPRGSRAQ
jgi:vacuolar-type H+-ATPase subunit E/Vma4